MTELLKGDTRSLDLALIMPKVNRMSVQKLT